MTTNDRDEINKKIKVSGSVAKFLAVAAVLGIVAFNSVLVVQTGNTKVQLTFGEMAPEPVGEGIHIVNPMSNFINIGLKEQTLTWKNVQIPAQDKLKSSIDVSVTYRVKESMAPYIYKSSGSMEQMIEKHLTPKVRSILREAGKSVEKSQDFFLNTVQVEMQSFVKNGLVEYLEPKGFEIMSVMFRDITLPNVVTNAVVETKKRQELVNQEKAQLEIVALVAQKEVKEAEARRDSAVSDAEAKRTLADAQAYEIEQLAKAQAKANKLVAASLSDRLINYTKVQKWNGTVPKTVMGDGKGVFISLPAGK